MTRIQYLRALALARAFGHEWGQHLTEADWAPNCNGAQPDALGVDDVREQQLECGHQVATDIPHGGCDWCAVCQAWSPITLSVEDIERLARERHDAAHDAPAVPAGQVATSGHEVTCSCMTCLRRRRPHHECPAGCGIMAPTESEPWRSLDHVTATGRLRWSIKADGDVLIDLHRPDHSKYLARLWVAGDRAGCAGIDTALSIHARHVDALREALIALVPEDLADAALADVASRALPDEVRA